jgi:hypothetical protein
MVLAASFDCKDGYHFMAEFPDENTVKITYNTGIKKQTDTETLTRTEGTEVKRFEDEGAIYTFAGEEAIVMTKSDRSFTTCSQPFDANNAPINFGDAGEGGGTRQDTGLIVKESIVGKWELTDAPENDPIEGLSFYREFKKNGEYSDILKGASIPGGQTVIPGTWEIFTKTNPPVDVNFKPEEDAVYIKMMTSEPADDKIYFKIEKVTPESLSLK